ncbi:MAG: ATP synthase F1 subunit gamma [Flavobacteriaceae bacterium]|jgi:F-type H+-transporting ATPase subunit gamma|nr:ATP synthase F1 subunit gamma [Flavobacteriaceae bacterium]MDO7581573.1 ATP synthase F1 subunit gamma [Flavobacteriaceae bacterium]MDO7590999.1 ATP synthase F1 subunit gamma [Flavobacteriaceae bacterium]MDO7599060.1 ATP synthase F1 subunit gamma [Flavobacteriaceae bacterium]MDO7604052.1 ATP synthase F1 subunit gamma [Flavobacteriaceae bacterium]|tara:strand:- start:489 stop:1352 length:864 start_codon:yes stop_codon:yes gene_type:complete
MANLKEIRNRIASVSSTMQITSAMKMVSAAKLKKAQDAITAMRPYSDKLTELIQNLSSSIDGDTQNPYTEQRPVQNVLVLVITSNRGLCGGFNSNVVKAVSKNISTVYANKKVSLITLGKKGNDILQKSFEIETNNNEIFDELTFSNASAIADSFMSDFTNKKYDKIEVVYNRFKNAATQIVTTETLLPIVSEQDDQNTAGADYIFEPTQENIVQELLPKSIKMQLFKALRDSFASEHGARMTAMHKATDNATELRDQLKLSYNQARQAAITNEILEIVGGAEALSS